MKKNHPIILVFYFLLMTACSGSALISEVEVNASENASAENTISVMAVHSGTPDEIGTYPDYLMGDGTKIFQNDLGFTITLEKGGISWEHLHLISEGDDEDCETGHDADLELMYVENLLENDLESVVLATDFVADVAYCQYEIHFGPENEESSGLDEFPEMVSHTVYVSGTWVHDGESGAFEIAVDDEIEIEGAFIASEGGENSMSVTFGTYYDRFFDGIDFSESDAALQEELTENLRNTFIVQSI